MEAHELTPEQGAWTMALTAELEQQIARVGVDMHAASSEMREIAPSVTRRISDDEFTESHIVDVSGIINALRSLPDGRGTAAFVAAYNARLLD